MPTHQQLPKVTLYEPTLGRLELGDRPYVVEKFTIGSPGVRVNTKNRALADGVFDDTVYHGSSAITLGTRLGSRTNCATDPALGMGELRDRLAAYMLPRLRPRLGWRYPYETVGRWAQVRGDNWPFEVAGPKYPVLVVQFVNPAGQAYLGDVEDGPETATAFPGVDPGGRSYDLTFDRSYPKVLNPPGAAEINNRGNAPADWQMQVHGPFDAGATVTLNGITIQFNQAVVVGEHVILDSETRSVMHVNGLSYYPYVNFDQWEWEDLELAPGLSYLSYNGSDAGNPSGWATIEWHSTVV